MVVDTDSYDVLLGLDFLIKIGTIVDVERGLIQVRHGPGVDVEVLPLTMVNMLQTLNPEVLMSMDSQTAGKSNLVVERPPMNAKIGDRRPDERSSDSDSEASENSEGEPQSCEAIGDGTDFGDTELEQLVTREGPQQILQLTLQEQANCLMKEEIGESDDYADWIKWVADEEQRKQLTSGVVDVKATALLQVQQLNDVVSCENRENQITGSKESDEDSRWKDICQKIRIDSSLDELKRPLLWKVLEAYQDVFAWNKAELGCCAIG